MPEPLTKAERRILDYIVDYLRRHTYQPSIREIGRRFDIRSTKTVSEYLQSLAAKGWIERDASRSRGVRVLGLNLSPGTVTVPAYTDSTLAAARGRSGAIDCLDLDRKLTGANGTFFIPMPGNGMRDAGILEDDLLLVEPATLDDVGTGDTVAAKLAGRITVSRYERRGGEQVLEDADSGPTPILVTGRRDFKLLGRVIGVVRRCRAAADGRVPAAAVADRQGGPGPT